MRRLSFLEPTVQLRPELVSTALSMVGLDVSPAAMVTWSEIDLLVVYDWAAREVLGIRRRAKPGLLAGARPFKIDISTSTRKRGATPGVRPT